MARSLKALNMQSQVHAWAPLNVDEHMPPVVMTAYLSYRLRLLEAEIETVSDALDAAEAAGAYQPTWSWSRRARNERRFSSLTHLNYLLTARDSIRKALATLEQ